jgi:YfiH family protein
MPENAPAPAGDPSAAGQALEERHLIVPDWPAPANVRARVTTRGGGCSRGAYASLNLAGHVGDDAAAVAANRRLLQSRIAARPCWLEQVHGTRCVEASIDDVPAADASFTRVASRACAILSADCLPVLLCDDAGSVVAAAHAGWRGLAAGVLESTVAALGVPGRRLMAWLGPAIGPRAFEVGDEVRAAFMRGDAGAQAAFVAAGNEGKWLCDLYLLARRRLRRLGVTSVGGGGFCTYGEPERFFSYRRDGATGRMATLIWLEP